jgi:phosphomannomutase
MKKLKQFIDNDLEYFTNLGNSEVETYDADVFDTETIDYLKTAKHNRFDYNGICVYLVAEDNEVWVENMNS